jgi:hypothetical protein
MRFKIGRSFGIILPDWPGPDVAIANKMIGTALGGGIRPLVICQMGELFGFLELIGLKNP